MPKNSPHICLAIGSMNHRTSRFFDSLKLGNPTEIPHYPQEFTNASESGCTIMVVAPNATTDIGEVLEIWSQAEEKPRLIVVSQNVDNAERAISRWLAENDVSPSWVKDVIKVTSYAPADVKAVIEQFESCTQSPAILHAPLNSGGRPSDVVVDLDISTNKKTGPAIKV